MQAGLNRHFSGHSGNVVAIWNRRSLHTWFRATVTEACCGSASISWTCAGRAVHLLTPVPQQYNPYSAITYLAPVNPLYRHTSVLSGDHSINLKNRHSQPFLFIGIRDFMYVLRAGLLKFYLIDTEMTISIQQERESSMASKFALRGLVIRRLLQESWVWV